MTENFIVAAAGHLLSPATSWSEAHQHSEGRTSPEDQEGEVEAARGRDQQLCCSGEL